MFGVRHPSGPSTPAAKDRLVATACRCGKIPPSCASGCGKNWDSEKFQASTRLLLVSTHRILRNNAPDPIDCHVVAVPIIQVIRPLVNQEPRLLTRHGKRTATGSKNADGEFERRNEERRLFQELSRYYPPGQDQSAWARQSLFSHGKHEHGHSARRRPSTYLNSSQLYGIWRILLPSWSDPITHLVELRHRQQRPQKT